MRTAIIVPGVTDLNKGDQALVWESFRLVQDTWLFDKVYLLSNGDTPEEEALLCNQTKENGMDLLPHILKHPRRGKHLQGNIIHESNSYITFQLYNAIRDYIANTLLLKFINQPKVLKFFFNRKVVDTVSVFAQADTIFVKGGGFIHAHGERTAPYVIWYLLYYVNLAKALKKKVVVLPNSYGPFKGTNVASQIKASFNAVSLILARERKSSNALRDLVGTNIPVSPDLGFYLRPSSKEVGKAILSKYSLNAESDRIVGLTLRPWRFPGKESKDELYRNYIDSVASLVKVLGRDGYKIAIFNQSMGPNAHEDDRNAIRELFQRNIHGSNCIWVDENLTCEQLKSVYSNLFFFIGTRFHSVIFAMTSSIPSIAIAYGGNKGEGIMQDFNLSDYVIHINEITPEALINMFNNAISNYDLIKSTLLFKTGQLNAKREAVIDLIKTAID